MLFRFRNFILLASLLPVLFGCTTLRKAREEASALKTRPNIIFILVDDQRNDTLGCAGHPVVKTPTVDRLASQGVRFENAFVTTPICAASRASIFTGLYERHHGFTFRRPPVSMAHAESSYPARLKEAGYRTAYIGKSHARFENPEIALATMFDVFEPVSSQQYIVQDKEGNYRHETEVCGQLAIDFIESNPEGQPFALSVGFFAAHAVDGDHRIGHHFQPMYETVDLYKDDDVPMPRYTDALSLNRIPTFLRDSLNGERWYWRWDSAEKFDRNMRDYYRLISGIDLTVSRILKAVEERGELENTIIVYSADNGYMMGDREMAGKWNHYEASLRVPLIIYDPRLPEHLRGRVFDQMALNIDIAPTLLDYGGISSPVHYDGVSLKPLLDGNPVPAWRDAFYCEHGMEHPRIPRWSGVRTKEFKYVVYPDFLADWGEILHHLVEDPEELENLVDDPEYEAELIRMRMLHQAFEEQIPTPLPGPEFIER